MMKRLFILGLDGIPFELAVQYGNDRTMPFLGDLFKNRIKKMKSVFPCVSSCAWTSFLTGQQPGKHGISGFIDRNSADMSLKIHFSDSIKIKTLFQILSESGMRVIALNVPVTTPPYAINGIMVSCFLSNSLDHAVYPGEYRQFFRDCGYMIDADPSLAKKNPEQFIEQVFSATQKRFEISEKLIHAEQWNLFQLHIMGTDRMNHFFFNSRNSEDNRFREYYRMVDACAEKLLSGLNKDDALIILSDHGFCEGKIELNLNFFLEQAGFLKFAGAENSLKNISDSSSAYSILPGRIYLKVQGREKGGWITPENYESVREKVKNCIEEIRLKSGENPCKAVHYTESLYGNIPEDGPDLIVEPASGINFKGLFAPGFSEKKSEHEGIHSSDNAFVFSEGISITENLYITDIYKGICGFFNIDESSQK